MADFPAAKPGSLPSVAPVPLVEFAEGPFAFAGIVALAPGAFEDPKREAEESLLVILSGTCDAFAGASVWKARGGRGTVLEGPPTSLFVPPGSAMRVTAPSAELLLLRARIETAVEEPAPLADKKHLTSGIPMYGTGKAFDPRTGAMVEAGSFALAPEARAPRHLPTERPGDGVEIRWICPPDYKAQTMAVAECVLEPGRAATIRVAHAPAASLPVRTSTFALYGSSGEAPSRVTVTGPEVSTARPPNPGAAPRSPAGLTAVGSGLWLGGENLSIRLESGTGGRCWFLIGVFSSAKESIMTSSSP